MQIEIDGIKMALMEGDPIPLSDFPYCEQEKIYELGCELLKDHPNVFIGITCEGLWAEQGYIQLHVRNEKMQGL